MAAVLSHVDLGRNRTRVVSDHDLGGSPQTGVGGLRLSNEGWLTVLDGPLYGIRHRRGLPVIGYVKTHHRRMLAREHWVRVPELTAGERSGLFAMEDALYGCYLRVGDPGPWAGPWAGIARLEMPLGIGRDAAVEAAERAAGWLPAFASALHWDARAPGDPACSCGRWPRPKGSVPGKVAPRRV